MVPSTQREKRQGNGRGGQLCESADGRSFEKHPADLRGRAGGAAQDKGDHKHRRRFTPYLTAGASRPRSERGWGVSVRRTIP